MSREALLGEAQRLHHALTTTRGASSSWRVVAEKLAGRDAEM